MLKVKNESPYPFVRATQGAIGFDLCANTNVHRDVPAGRRWAFDTGISIELPLGWGALVQPRSGLGLHHGIVALTGVIDQDYRGQIKVILLNTTTEPYRVAPGDRIAQLVLIQIPNISMVLDVPLDQQLSDTKRGGSGFGSTGR